MYAVATVSVARPFAGEVVALLGRLSSLSRSEAVEIVQRGGGLVDAGPSERTTLLVAGADAPARNAQSGARPRTLSEDEFCRLAGRVSPSDLRQQFYPFKTIRTLYPAVGENQLRYLEKWGLLASVVHTPADTWYSFADVASIKQVQAELEGGARFQAVVRALVAARAGQLSLDFQPGREEGAGESVVVSLVSRASRARPASAASPDRSLPLTPAEARFVEGEHHDSGEIVDTDAAMQAYRDALMLDPGLAPAMINLGNLHYLIDELPEAQAFYVQAALVDPEAFEAHFNLGNIHHDCGRFEPAAACYETALRLNPAYPDAHFYLAVTLEKLGRSTDARGHWREYRRLAPEGEWVDLAREFSD